MPPNTPLTLKIETDEDASLVTSTTSKTPSTSEFSEEEEKLPIPSVISDENWSSDRRCAKFQKIWRNFSLGHLFGILGSFIGSHPLVFFLVALVFASTSAGMYKMKLQDRLRDGYTPTNSLSRYESDVYREFLGLPDDPIVTVALFRAKDGGTMHRPKYLNEVIELHRYLKSNLSCDYQNRSNGHVEKVNYSDICGPFCDANVVIEYFAETLKDELKRIEAGKPKSFSVNLTYPITTIRGFSLHLERNFFGVKMAKNSTFTSEKDDLSRKMNMITPIKHVEAIMMLFRGGGDDEQKMAQWEMALYKFSRDKFSSDILDIIVLGSEIVDYEMNRDAQKTVPYFIFGFSSMLIFVFATVLLSSYYYGVLDFAKLLVAFATTLCPVLAITTTFGILSIIKMRTNTIMMIMPFLIMGIGVNDAFLMIHAWHRTAKHGLPIPKRLSLVLEEVGPSITITTLTNVITFSIGSFTPTPEIQLFCTATAIALGLAYVYCLILFIPVLYVATVFEDKKDSHKTNKKAYKIKKILSTLCQFYSKIIWHRITNYVLLIAVFIYWYFAILGTMILESKLDTEKIIPPDNPLRTPNEIFMRIVYQEYYPVTVFVNNPLDIRSRSDLDGFFRMLDEFENMRLCRGKELTILWLRDYIDYINTYEDFDYYSEDGIPKTSLKKASTETGVDYRRLKEFLTSPIYKYHKSFMKFDETKLDLPLSKFMFIVTYHNTTSWDDRIEIVQTSRDIASRYPRMNVTIWEANAMFVDQMLSLKAITLLTCVITLGCMALVCCVFIQNPISVIIATMAILSIGLGVIGFLSLWHLDLDPVTMCAVLMSIGMSVDFTAHVAYNFQLTEKAKLKDGKIVKIQIKTQHEKLINTLQSVGWPMIQGGFSTMLTILPLALLQDYVPLVFVKTIALVVVWGLLHGLVVLPAFLVFLPKNLLEVNCFKLFGRKITRVDFNEKNNISKINAKSHIIREKSGTK